MKFLFDLFAPLTWRRTNRSDHVVDSAQFFNGSFESQISQTNISDIKELYYAFLEESNNNSSLESRISSALKAANIDASPIKLFEAINGFTISVSPAEAERLEAIPTIRSIEADRPLPLTPPVEVIPETNNSAAESSLLSERGSSSGRREIDRSVSLDQYYVKTNTRTSKEELRTNGVSAAALPIYNNGSASTGEILPYGVKAVWGGSDISTKGNAGSGTYAFVIDSGVLDTTGDLNVNKTWSKSWVSGETAFTDGNGHGTHVAGTIAALANGVGVVGVAPGAEVISLKVFNSAGGGASYSTIIDAVNYATQVINNKGLDKSKVVINMSLGGGYSAGMDAAVKNAANQGIKFSIAAGNSGADADGYSPASAGDHANIYTVSAVDNQYQMSSWSNWDDQSGSDDVDVAAPGVSVLSYYKGGQLANLSGTSMAAPHVAGLLLMGGVKEGDMVKANWAGHADPFALATLDEDEQPNPEPPPPKDDDSPYSYLFLGNSSNKSGDIVLSTGSGSLQQSTLESQLGLITAALDGTLNGTKAAINAIEGSGFQASGAASAGDIISFLYTFSSEDYLPYADFSFTAVNNSVKLLSALGADTPNKGKTSGSFEYTFSKADFEGEDSGNFSFSLGVVDAIDTGVNSNLNVFNFSIEKSKDEGERYSDITARYYYGNGDFYTISGTVNSSNGGGSFKPGDIINANTNDSDSYAQLLNETGKQGYYEIVTVTNSNGTNSEGLTIDSYYDQESQYTLIPYKTTLGTAGLGSESGLLSKKGILELDQINNILEADIFLANPNGNNHLTGNSTNNILIGHSGNDVLNAHGGNDVLDGGGGNDVINGGSGRDTAQFSSRSNLINLNTTRWQNTRDGRDRLISIENVNAGSGNDRITGSSKSNTLNGQNGNDKLYGGGGNDLLIGGGGKDRVWGQGGRDTFRVQRGTGYTIIEDFTNKQDRIHLGSGASGLRFQTRGDDMYLYQQGDLMAIVENAAGDLQISGNFLV